MKQANVIELKANLKNLKLSAMVSELEMNLRQATESGVGYDEFLINLTDLEIESRSASRLKRRIREAKFPHVGIKALAAAVTIWGQVLACLLVLLFLHCSGTIR